MKALLIFLLVVIVLFSIARWMGRLMLQGWIDKKQKEFSHQQKDNLRRGRREGEVRVEKTASAAKKVNKDVGDYVEYEEVE